ADGRDLGPDQSEIADLDMAAHQEQVSRLDIQMLQAVLDVHDVQRLRHLAEVTQQGRARYAGQALGPVFGEHVTQLALGQLHPDDQVAVYPLGAIEIENEGMANRLDALDGR